MYVDIVRAHVHDSEYLIQISQMVAAMTARSVMRHHHLRHIATTGGAGNDAGYDDIDLWNDSGVALTVTVAVCDGAAANATKSTMPIPTTLMFPLAVSNFKQKHNYA